MSLRIHILLSAGKFKEVYHISIRDILHNFIGASGEMAFENYVKSF